jgi:hypothetical protein
MHFLVNDRRLSPEQRRALAKILKDQTEKRGG